MSRGGWLSLALVAILGTLGALWFFSAFEKKEIDVELGYRGEARANPLLAARRFLRRMGIEAATPSRIIRDDGSLAAEDVLLLATSRWTLSDTRAADLLDWVRAGGHLIVTARPGADGDEEFETDAPIDDPLLQSLGVSTWRSALDEDGDVVEETLAVQAPGAAAPLRVSFNSMVRLFDIEETFSALAADRYGACVLHRVLERGAITILCDTQALHNQNIGEHDHAAFLWHLVNLRFDASAVWLVHDDDMPALPVWLWQHARLAMVSLGVLLVMTLWAANRRFGPVLDVPSLDRRQLLEHVDASGRFLWEHGHRERLLAGIREAVEHTATLRHPGWTGLTHEERVGKLAVTTAVPKPIVEHALNGIVQQARNAKPPKELKREQFEQTIRNLQTIRKKL